MTSKKNQLYNICKAHIEATEAVWQMIEEAGMMHEQFCLDWLDSLNAISIRN